MAMPSVLNTVNKVDYWIPNMGKGQLRTRIRATYGIKAFTKNGDLKSSYIKKMKTYALYMYDRTGNEKWKTIAYECNFALETKKFNHKHKK